MYSDERYHRRSIRLQGYDYSQNGAYVVTICTQDRVSLFGEITEAEMVLNNAGKMVERWWLELAHKFPQIELDAHVVMPNHFHGIVVIVGADLCVCPSPMNRQEDQGAHTGAPLQDLLPNPSLSQIVQWFKTMTTNEYIRRVNNQELPPFRGRLWQRNFYEQVIRNDATMMTFRDYIVTNPGRWAEDRENLAKGSRN
jgi:REP element-mobilizing transposase RayT